MSFTANYPGECGAGDEIEPGDLIESYQGEYWHAECARIDAEIPPKTVVCQGCFIEKPCACDDEANAILDQMGIGVPLDHRTGAQ